VSDAGPGSGACAAAIDALRAAVARGRREPLPAAAAGAAGLEELLDELVDVSRFALALSQGDLDQKLRHSGMMAGSLKALQGALRHLTWQTQRVAGGDFSQRVDFMGEFSEAFNSMVVALGEARAELAQTNRELQELNERLEEMATTDALTGASNRREFNGLVHTEVTRAHRYDQPLSLFILDIDHFKRVNDTFGHEIGDVVLVELADLLRAAMRGGDSLARWGGEEFVVLTPGVDGCGSLELAERMRAGVAAHVFPVAGRVTVSIGVAKYVAGDTANKLFSRADSALYAAKQGGRDRVELAK
jgi:diguanylate cyclase (GGDEF)-like protein